MQLVFFLSVFDYPGYPGYIRILKLLKVIMLLNSQFSAGYTERQISLLTYLKCQVHGGKCFFKAKHIAREIGLSSREVGTNMGILAQTCDELSISRYGYSNSTTWRVTDSREKLS